VPNYGHIHALFPIVYKKFHCWPHWWISCNFFYQILNLTQKKELGWQNTVTGQKS